MMHMASAAQRGLAVESFGARLKRERERQGLTLDTVASATKIGTRLLQALEEEKFDRLPGGIFNKGFVRAYARHLGLDEQQAIADYLAAAGGPLPTKEPEAVVAAIAARKVESRPEKQATGSGGFPWGRITILLLVIAVCLALWSSRSSNSRAHPRGNSPAPASGPRPASSAPASAQPSQTAPAAGSFSLLIRAQQDSWLSITIDGEERPGELLRAQSEKSIAANQKIVVKAGNVGGLNFSMNGKQLPVSAGPNEVRTLTFDASGLGSSSQ